MNRNLLLLSISLMTWGIGEGMWLLFQPLYLSQLGAGPVLIGAIQGLSGLSMAVAHLPAGYLSDRFGRRTLLIWAWFLGALATCIMALANSIPVFVIGSALYGVTSFVVVPLNGYVTVARGNRSVGRAITLISAMFNLGVIPGPILGGWVGEHFGLRTNFFVAAIFFIISSALIISIERQPVEPPSHEAKQIGLSWVLNARYIQYLIVVFTVMFCMYLPQPLSQNFLQDQRGVDLQQMGVLISARGVGAVVLNLVLGQLNARFGFLLAQVAMAAFTLLIWRGSGVPSYLLGYLLMGSYQTGRLLAIAQGRALLKNENMNLGYGVIETCMALVLFLAPPLAGYLYSLNPTWIYSVSFGMILAALASSLLFSPLRARDLVEYGVN
jgi:MFS family permease